MNDMTLFWLMMALVFVLTIIFLAIFRKKTKFEIFNDLIVINDFVYPANIPNYVIKSISLVEKLPKVMMRSNGYGGLNTWKGVFRILGGKRALFYVENHFKGPLIKIDTVRESIYINFKNKEQTYQLYDDMTKNVKILDETNLSDYKFVDTKRSWVSAGIFIAIVTVVALIPAFVGF